MKSTIYQINENGFIDLYKYNKKIKKILLDGGFIDRKNWYQVEYLDKDINNTRYRVSWSYENYKDKKLLVDVNKEFSKNSNVEEKHISKDEVIKVIECFYKCIKDNLNIEEFDLNSISVLNIAKPTYILANNFESNWNSVIKDGVYEEKIPLKINIYYFNKIDSDLAIAAYERLQFAFRGLRLKTEFNLSQYKVEASYKIEDQAINCLIIKPKQDINEAAALCNELKDKKFFIFDYDKLNEKTKWANIAYQILYSAGSKLWRLKQLNDYKNNLYIGMDLGHDRDNKKSRLSICLFNYFGEEFKQYRIIKEFSLNEKIKISELVFLLNNAMELIRKEYYFDSIIIHKDGNILEDVNELYKNLKNDFFKLAFIEIIKSNSAYIFDSDSGNWYDFDSFQLLNTLPSVFLNNYQKPIKIKIRISDVEKENLIKQIYNLVYIYAGDTIYGGRKLPITTYLADKYSSFNPYKILQSYNK